MENEILKQKNEQNNNEEKSEHRKDPVDQDTEENSVTNKEESQTMSIRQSRRKQRNIWRNHKQEDKEESITTQNDQIREVDSFEDRVQDKNSERNNEEAEEENYASNEGLNKTKKSDRRENNEFELESQTNGTELVHVHLKEREMVASENQAEKKNDSQKSSITDSDKREQEPNKPPSDHVEALHLHNGTNTTSNRTEKQLETSENSKVKDSIFHNKTLSDAAVEQVDSILTNSSGAHERNVTNGEYSGKANAN
ncbi:hypothetical protein D0Y65_002065 [Glycine soja]|uniref:Uncharacterized protein n=1 Tax=Glycine soja TaxID=3848 RepID=A0A445M5G9_GLYSO|nr:hypothetical protein D0Y65_002065 [Glycine soja]